MVTRDVAVGQPEGVGLGTADPVLLVRERELRLFPLVVFDRQLPHKPVFRRRYPTASDYFTEQGGGKATPASRWGRPTAPWVSPRDRRRRFGEIARRVWVLCRVRFRVFASGRGAWSTELPRGRETGTDGSRPVFRRQSVTGSTRRRPRRARSHGPPRLGPAPAEGALRLRAERREGSGQAPERWYGRADHRRARRAGRGRRELGAGAPARALRRARSAAGAQPGQGVAGGRRRAAGGCPGVRGGAAPPGRGRRRSRRLVGADLGAHRGDDRGRPRRQDRHLPRRRRHRGPALRGRRAARAGAVPPVVPAPGRRHPLRHQRRRHPRRAARQRHRPRRDRGGPPGAERAHRAHPPDRSRSTPTSASSAAARPGSRGTWSAAGAARSRRCSACRPRASSPGSA